MASRNQPRRRSGSISPGAGFSMWSDFQSMDRIPLAEFLDVFLVVFADVVEEFFAFEDLDVGGEAEDEAGGAFEAVDGGGEDPFAVDAFEVLFGEGVFLDEEGFGAGVELEGDGLDGGAGHAEDVGGFDLVPFFEGPGGVGDLDFVDAHDFVDAAVGLLDVVGPDVDHVGGEGEGFDQAVAGVVAVGRFVAL